MRRHGGIDAQRWYDGVEIAVTLDDGEQVRLALEQDPLEVLKLGSYVGSCVGLGGSQSYSAIAVLLDANKQVVYARNARGRVLARQLIALSEKTELVVFAVYPESAKALIPAFRKFDNTFARHLGVPLCRTSDYEIALILAQDWWDDVAWGSGGLSRPRPRS